MRSSSARRFACNASSTPIFKETVPHAAVVHYDFPARGDMPAVKLNWYDGGILPARPDAIEPDRELDPEDGIIFVGDKGTMLVEGWGGEKPRLLPESRHKQFTPPPKTLPRSIGHHAEWVQACKKGTPTASSFAFAGPLTEAVLLGSLAIRMEGRTLTWDPVAMKIQAVPRPRSTFTTSIGGVDAVELPSRGSGIRNATSTAGTKRRPSKSSAYLKSPTWLRRPKKTVPNAATMRPML